MGNGIGRRMRPDTRATHTAWQWPKSGSAREGRRLTRAGPPPISRLFPPQPEKRRICGDFDARSGGGLAVRFKKGFAPLRSLVAHWHHFSLDRTDWRIDILMMGTASALARVTGFPA
jgi:hypothetical protein